MVERKKSRFEGREHPVTKAGGHWKIEEAAELDVVSETAGQEYAVNDILDSVATSFEKMRTNTVQPLTTADTDNIQRFGEADIVAQEVQNRADSVVSEDIQKETQYKGASMQIENDNTDAQIARLLQEQNKEEAAISAAALDNSRNVREAEYMPLTKAERKALEKQRKQRLKQQKKVKEKARNCTLGDLEFMTDVEAALYRRGHPFAFILSFSIIVVFLVFLVWAKFAIIDQVTRGTGQVIPSQRTQEIQNLEGGILEKIYVQDGEIVKKGQLLLTINNQSAESYYKDQLSKYYENLGAVARIRALLDNKEPVYPEELKEKAPNVIVGQNQILETERAKMASEIIVLENQYKQRIQEEREAASTVRRLKQSLRLAQEQRAIAKPLLDKGIYSRVEYLALEQKVVDTEGQLANAEISLTRLGASISEAKQRIDLRKAELRTQALDELSKREAELVSTREAIAAGGDRVARLEIRAPIQATVKRILIRTAGGVIKPGETIMELVPLDDTLLVEARINPKDRAFVHPGLSAMVKISSFDYAIYGGLEATVEQISADTLEDKRGEFYYQVILRTKKNVIEARGEVHPIIPGMTATVDILTGKRSVLDYLLKPILRARSNALSER